MDMTSWTDSTPYSGHTAFYIYVTVSLTVYISTLVSLLFVQEVVTCILYTVCPRSSYPFCIASNYIKWLTVNSFTFHEKLVK